MKFLNKRVNKIFGIEKIINSVYISNPYADVFIDGKISSKYYKLKVKSNFYDESKLDLTYYDKYYLLSKENKLIIEHPYYKAEVFECNNGYINFIYKLENNYYISLIKFDGDISYNEFLSNNNNNKLIDKILYHSIFLKNFEELIKNYKLN